MSLITIRQGLRGAVLLAGCPGAWLKAALLTSPPAPHPVPSHFPPPGLLFLFFFFRLPACSKLIPASGYRFAFLTYARLHSPLFFSFLFFF